MKNLKSLILGMLLFMTMAVNAQVTVNVNIGSPPAWGPSGYSQVRYYYLPDVQAYYDISSARFIYLHNGNWIHRSYLPSRYRGYDLYSGYKVVMKTYKGNAPYIHYNYHKGHYKKGYKGRGPQKTIGHKPGKGNAKPNPGSGNKKASPGKAKSHNSPSHKKASPGGSKPQAKPSHHKQSPGNGSHGKGGNSKGGGKGKK